LNAFTHNIIKHGNSLEATNTSFAEGRGDGGNIEELAHAVLSRQQYTPQNFSDINLDKI